METTPGTEAGGSLKSRLTGRWDGVQDGRRGRPCASEVGALPLRADELLERHAREGLRHLAAPTAKTAFRIAGAAEVGG
eukprot:5404046-Alexandrium_andersonii.AAC.1